MIIDIFSYNILTLGSMFLSDLNNLKPVKNPEYKRVITSLENFVMIMWEDDATIIPRV